MFGGRDLRLATMAHLPALRALRSAEGWDASEWMLRALLALPEAGVLIAGPDEAPTGVAAFTRFGRLGRVSNVIVASAYRGRGLGRQLMERILAHLTAAGVTQVELDSTRTGRPLYERLGFVPRDRTRTVRLARAPACACPPGVTIANVTAADLPALIAFDQRVIGIARAPLFGYLFAQPDWRWLRATDRQGAIAGYLAARPDGLGPWIARDPAIAAALLAALDDGVARYLAFPEANSNATTLFTALDATPIDLDTHMVWGSGVDTAWAFVYALAHAAIG
jgi:GNAT superfamily N-acetyltransferase